MSIWLMKPLSVGSDKSHLNVDNLIFPFLVSRKLDGIRACVNRGELLSNSFTAIPSKLAQERFGYLEAFDGELIYGDPTNPECYNLTSSAVRSFNFPEHLDPDELRFYVFDRRIMHVGAQQRLEQLKKDVEALKNPHLIYVEQTMVHSFDELEAVYHQYLEEGYEGLIGKRPGLPYRKSRAGKTDQSMIRMKPFGTEFFEAQIIGYTCAFENQNTAFLDALGNTKRSSSKEGKVPLDMLGSFQVRDCKSGIEFDLPASSMTHAERYAIWKNIDNTIGKYVRYTCMTYGTKVKPRMPSFRGFRDTFDFNPKGE